MHSMSIGTACTFFPSCWSRIPVSDAQRSFSLRIDYIGSAKQKGVSEHAQNSHIHPAHVQNLIQAFALLTDSKYPDQTAQMHRLT